MRVWYLVKNQSILNSTRLLMHLFPIPQHWSRILTIVVIKRRSHLTTGQSEIHFCVSFAPSSVDTNAFSSFPTWILSLVVTSGSMPRASFRPFPKTMRRIWALSHRRSFFSPLSSVEQKRVIFTAFYSMIVCPNSIPRQSLMADWAGMLKVLPHPMGKFLRFCLAFLWINALLSFTPRRQIYQYQTSHRETATKVQYLVLMGATREAMFHLHTAKLAHHEASTLPYSQLAVIMLQPPLDEISVNTRDSSTALMAILVSLTTFGKISSTPLNRISSQLF
mmetsp:Transcript_34610/g.101704  ORF Transcript_34610/g.101704 Transcript_34610/m.101704 type:complete len:278 (+) Transcript_34610:1903-2736(+)